MFDRRGRQGAGGENRESVRAADRFCARPESLLQFIKKFLFSRVIERCRPVILAPLNDTAGNPVSAAEQARAFEDVPDQR